MTQSIPCRRCCDGRKVAAVVVAVQACSSAGWIVGRVASLGFFHQFWVQHLDCDVVVVGCNAAAVVVVVEKVG